MSINSSKTSSDLESGSVGPAEESLRPFGRLVFRGRTRKELIVRSGRFKSRYIKETWWEKMEIIYEVYILSFTVVSWKAHSTLFRFQIKPREDKFLLSWDNIILKNMNLRLYYINFGTSGVFTSFSLCIVDICLGQQSGPYWFKLEFRNQ